MALRPAAFFLCSYSAAGFERWEMNNVRWAMKRGDGGIELVASVDGISVGDGAADANLKKVFWIEGASSLNLDGSRFSSSNTKVSVAKPLDGKVKFTVSPKGEIPPRFFFKVKLKWSAEKDSNTKRCAEEDISSRAFCSFLRMVCGVRCARIGQVFDTTKADDDCSFALGRTAQKRGCVFGREMR